MELQNKEKTILHCVDSLAVGGAEVLLKETLPLLNDYNNIVCYLHPPDNLISEFEDYPVYCLNFYSKFSFFIAVRRLRKIIRQNNVSIVHAHLFYSTLVARIACPRHIRFFFTIHSMLGKDAFEVNRFSLWAERLTYRKRQAIIGVSKEVLSDYDKWIGINGKSFVLHNYVNEKFFDLRLGLAPEIFGAFRLVAVGNLKRAKNYFNLLDAMSLLKDQPISLDIYGGGDLEDQLKSRIKNEKLSVRLMGRTADVSKILPGYHAYIMPSLYEGYGLAPMEAIAAGMPALLSDLPVFKELVEDIPAYFDPTDPRSISNAIQYAKENWGKMISNVERGKHLVKQKASKQTYISKLIEIYNG